VKRRFYQDTLPRPAPTDRRPPWTRPTSGRLVAGEVSARTAYRWLRRQRRNFGDVYLRIEWNPQDGELHDPAWHGDDGPRVELPDAVWGPLWAFELPCKLLDAGRCSLEVRTRRWRGEARVRGHDHSPGERDARLYTDDHDRGIGLWYARLLARLLRAAHRAGVRLAVRGLP